MIVVHGAAPRFGCPECGSPEIREGNTVIADYPVTAWDENGEPIAYEEASVCWDTAEAVDGSTRFMCANDHAFEAPVKIR